MSDKLGDPKKGELQKLVSDAADKAASIQRMGQSLVKGAVQSLDVASCLSQFLQRLPEECLPRTALKHEITGWQMWHKRADQALASAGTVYDFTVAVSTATATTSGTFVNAVLYEQSPEIQNAVRFASAQMNKIIECPVLMNEVKSCMKRLGLDRASHSNRGPLDLLEEAYAALERPSGSESSPVAVLISLRESVNMTLSELLRRRPTQEPAGNQGEKVRSIGRQCGRAEVAADIFNQQADVVDDLIANLSSAKSQALSRTRMSELLTSGLLFLKAFLDSLDSAKMRA